MVSLIKRSMLITLAAAMLAMLGGASPAFAESPWWHLSSGSAPAYLHSGRAKDEVQELTVESEEPEEPYDLVVRDAREKLAELVEVNTDMTHEQLQSVLEAAYGKGNVTVSGGPGKVKPYEIAFTGELAGEPVTAISTAFNPSVATVTVLVKGSPDGEIVVTAANLGDANTKGEGTILDRLPPKLKVVSIEDTNLGTTTGPFPSTFDDTASMQCQVESSHLVACPFSGEVLRYQPVGIVIGVDVLAGASSSEVNEVSVSGGGAPSASIARAIDVNESATPFGVEDYELTPEEEGGAVDTQAGSHPFQLTTTIMLNETAERNPAQLVKDLNFKLPVGLIGNPTPVVKCSLSQFYADLCPSQSAVGVATATITDPQALGKIVGDPVLPYTVPLYNLEPLVGEPARFAFDAGRVPVFLDTALRTGSDYGVTVKVDNITQEAGFLGSQVTFWGNPGDKRHDNTRSGCLPEGDDGGAPCQNLDERHPPSFLTMPTSCAGALQTSVEADSWDQAGAFSSVPASEAMPAMDGCNRLLFNPSISVTPDGQAASTPTGLAVTVHVPQEVTLNPEGLAEADVKDTTVTLPQGVTMNPAAADGLQSCTEEQVSLDTPSASLCPEASKVGLVKIKTPLLPNPLEGAVYLATQDANPFGSLVALYVFAEDPISGARVKLAGEVVPNPVTGQLVSTFKNTPQLPFETFELHFFGGDRAPLSTPSACGAYTTTASVAPWSGNEPVNSDSTFDVISGPNGGPCASPLPFSPSLTGGTTSIQAGGFSPFTMTMSRPDGSQNLQAIQLHMPPGLLGTLSSVKLCQEAQANAGTCGPESLIGHTIVSVGVGGDPYSVTGGEVFITGGYEGAPYGLSIVNPAKAGPFDLGKVIVRAKIEVDPITAGLTITTDNSGPYKIPTILDGIPLQIQHINVSIDRPNFTFNPTNCTPTAITGSLSSSEGANETLKVPFQATNCAILDFKPQFKVSTAGKTSRTKGASLDVKLAYPKAAWGTQADLKSVKVDLPKQLPSRLTTLQKACPNTVFEANPASCPPDSRIGSATATTPIVPVALSGPAYFVSYGGAKFPELVIVLSGYGVTVDLHGETFISPAGITSSTFRTIPDVPIGSFELKLPEGPFSALGANKNLCTVKGGLKMPTVFTAQNGLVIKQSTKIGVTGCPKAKATKSKKAPKGHKKK